jgi:hypothetical protein
VTALLQMLTARFRKIFHKKREKCVIFVEQPNIIVYKHSIKYISLISTFALDSLLAASEATVEQNRSNMWRKNEQPSIKLQALHF